MSENHITPEEEVLEEEEYEVYDLFAESEDEGTPSFEPEDGDDEVWETAHDLADEHEIELTLTRLKKLRATVKTRDDHADAYIAAAKAKYDEAVEVAKKYRRTSTKRPLNRINWHLGNLEAILRQQPDKVRSMAFINGKISRRAMGMTCKVAKGKAALLLIALRKIKQDELIRTKETEEPNASEIKKAILAG